jgi:hypothetical protein
MATTGRREPGVLAAARYGKDKVRVFRVVRDPESKVHDVVEYNVTVQVEGAIETRCVSHSDTTPLTHLLGCRRIGVVLSFCGGFGAVTRKRTIAWSSRRTQVGRPPFSAIKQANSTTDVVKNITNCTSSCALLPAIKSVCVNCDI